MGDTSSEVVRMDQSTLNHLFQSTSSFNLTDEIVFVSADNSVYQGGETKEDLNAIFQGFTGSVGKDQIVETDFQEREVCPFTELCTIQLLTVALKGESSEVNEVTIPEALASSLRFCCKVCEESFQNYSVFNEHVKTHRKPSGDLVFDKKSPRQNDLYAGKITNGSGDHKQSTDNEPVNSSAANKLSKVDDFDDDSPSVPDFDDSFSDTEETNSSQITSIAQELVGLATSVPKCPISLKQPEQSVPLEEEEEKDPFLMLQNSRFDFVNVFCFQDMSCSRCNAHFTHDALWEEHVRLVHQITAPYQCIVCGQENNDMESLRGHVIKVHGKFSVMVCEKKWNKHKTNVKGDLAEPCQLCRGSGMSDREALKFVQQTAPPPDSACFKRKYVPRSDRTCHICGKVLSNRYISKHMKLHSGVKPFECSFCGQTYIEKLALNRHLRTHTKEKPFKCAQCGCRFSLESTLSRHMYVHTGVKNHVCSVCQKRFARKSGLKKHLLTHTVAKEFDCTLCDRSFTLRRYLWRHYKKVHGYSVSLK